MAVFKKSDAHYYTEKTINKKKTYVKLEPQPFANELLNIKRCYNTLALSEKGPEQFKRRCTWVTNAPVSMQSVNTEVVIIEYIGKFPGRKAHGQSKHCNDQVYIRTKPSVQNQLEEQLRTKNVKQVEQEMNININDDLSKQRNEKQLRNIKHKVNKTSNSTPLNAADQIVQVEEMTNTHELVYSVKHIKGQMHPVITLCSEQQLTDIRRFCGKGNAVLGVDKTYNLGDFHVTPTVYKDLSVLRRSTQDHPISFGPTLIHTNSSAKTYCSFFHDIADNLTENEIENLVIGSDEEKAFKVAIKRAFPEATQTLCTRHLRQNTVKYMEDTVGYPKKDRQRIADLIYGDNGLTSSKDSDTYEYRLTEILCELEKLDNCAGEKKMKPYFADKLIPNLKNHVIKPFNEGKVNFGWTNNNCESANHILKSATGWKAQDIPRFIELFTKIIKSENVERCRAIRGSGNYELAEKFAHHRVDIDKWGRMSNDAQDARERRFKTDKGKTNPNIIISSDGQRTVIKTPQAGKKPNQLKRKRAERSRTPTKSAKRKL